MHRLLMLTCLLPLAASASDHWNRFLSGPFEVYSSTGEKDGRETLVRCEEFRHALGTVLGEDDLETPVPIRVLLFKSGAPQTSEPIVRGRDAYGIVLTAGKPIPSELFVRLTQLFLETNSNRMPERIERGLVALFSTIEVTGIRITLGRPPAHPDLDWARVHLLAVDPQYFGNLRVLTFNLRKGVNEDAAFRNAFGKTPEQIELEAQQHLAAGHFQTATISSLPMSARDYPERAVDQAAAKLAVADLLLDDSSTAAYRELIAQKEHIPEAYEGLGLLALRAQQPAEARQDFEAAMTAGSKSPNCYMEYARVETDNAKALAALDRAAQLNPKLAEPHFMMAARQTDLQIKIAQLKLATKLDPRNTAYWQALAEAYMEDKSFSKAEQSWRSAEQSAATPIERARFERERSQMESQRLDWEAAERKRKADEDAREIDKLKAEARAEVHALESRANHGQTPPPSNEKPVPWWDGPKPGGTASGVLKQVDCLGKRFRLTVEGDNRQTVKLLVPDPKQLAVLGGGELTLTCGAQAGRRVRIEYFPKANPKLSTAGEAATIEFQ